MGASITLAGESLIAQKQAGQQILDVARFIFANVPGLDASGPVDRAAVKPPIGQIVHVQEIDDENAGFVNPNQVVYSAQIGSDVGDWDFNWIGLESAEGVLFAVAYVALQQKRRNIPPQQIGNNLTRNFLVAYDGAQALTGITIDASTWQHDFTVRLAGIDERERLSNRDIFGRACFFGSSLQLEKVAGSYQVKPGSAYVEGIRVVRSTVLQVVPAAFPTTAWLEVALQRELSDVVASWTVVFGTNLADYTDSAGVRHFRVPIADLPNSNTVTDRRVVEPIDGPLVAHFAARTGDYEHLRARGTTKEDVDLGNLPNAKSDSLVLDSSESLATSRAVATLWKSISVQKYSFTTDKVLTAAERGLVLVDASNQAHEITLPPATEALGVIDFIIRRTDNTGNRIVVRASGSDRIKFHTHLNAAGYPFLVLMGAGDWWHLRSDKAGGWVPMGRLDTSTLGRVTMESMLAIPPGGYGTVNGQIFQRSEWPWLWDLAQQSGMLTTEAARVGMEGGWTSGDGVGTFRGPEVRAEFLRVLDEGRGKDVGRVAGSYQKPSIVTGDTTLTTLTIASPVNRIDNSNDTFRSIFGYDPVPDTYPQAAWSSVGQTSAGILGDVSAFGAVRPRNIAYPGRLKLI